MSAHALGVATFRVVISRDKLARIHAERARCGLSETTDEVLAQYLVDTGTTKELLDLAWLADSAATPKPMGSLPANVERELGGVIRD